MQWNLVVQVHMHNTSRIKKVFMKNKSVSAVWFFENIFLKSWYFDSKILGATNCGLVLHHCLVDSILFIKLDRVAPLRQQEKLSQPEKLCETIWIPFKIYNIVT